MHTIEEINAMSEEELAAYQRKLGRKLAIKFVVVPVVTAAAFYVLGKVVDRKMNATAPTE